MTHQLPTNDEQVIRHSSAIRHFGVSLGVNANGRTEVARGMRFFVPASPDLCGADIALLELDQDLPSATTAVVRFAPLKIGETTIAVGYGDDGTGRIGGEHRADHRQYQ